MKLGKLIFAYRDCYRISLRELAKEIGVTPSMLSRLENGKAISNKSFFKILIWLEED